MGIFKDWASPGTLRGKLQRGLGSGYLQALDAPRAKVHAVVTECIEVYPRWDIHLDDRDWYFAALAADVELPLGPLIDHLATHDGNDTDDTSFLILEVLGKLAVRGNGEAIAALRAYVDHGYWWSHAVQALGETGNPTAWAGLEAVVLRRTAALGEEEWIYGLDELPFTAWVEQGERARSILAPPRTRQERKPRPDPGKRTTAYLLRGSDEPAYRRWPVLAKRRSRRDVAAMRTALEDPRPETRTVAAVALAAQGDPAAFVETKRIIEDAAASRAARAHALRVFADLPADLVLPVAREWRSRRWPRSVAADHVLKRYATEADVPWIRRGIVAPATDQRMYRLCSALEIIARFPDQGPFPEVERAFRTMRYSYGRRFAAEALAATDPEFGRTVAFECLFDSNGQTRAIGAQHVDLGLPGARDRLAGMLDDPTEEESVKAAARARLGG